MFLRTGTTKHNTGVPRGQPGRTTTLGDPRSVLTHRNVDQTVNSRHEGSWPLKGSGPLRPRTTCTSVWEGRK